MIGRNVEDKAFFRRKDGKTKGERELRLEMARRIGAERRGAKYAEKCGKRREKADDQTKKKKMKKRSALSAKKKRGFHARGKNEVSPGSI